MNGKNWFVAGIVLAACCVGASSGRGAEEAWNATLATGKKPPAAAPREDGKLSIIAFGAHPDDSELKAGGVGALWAAQGHHVKLVSTTNGDVGHWRPIVAGAVAIEPFRELWAYKILQHLLERGKIGAEVVENIRSWEHSGFSVDKSVRIEAGDRAGLELLLRYIVRMDLHQCRRSRRTGG